MPIGDPRDGFFYPIITLMMDSYYVDFCLQGHTGNQTYMNHLHQSMLALQHAIETDVKYVYLDYGIKGQTLDRNYLLSHHRQSVC